MATNDSEIEATQKKSRELAAQAEALIKAAQDPNRDLRALAETADREFERFIEVAKREDAPEGTGAECLLATIDLIGEWARVDGTAIEGLAASVSGQPGPASGPTRTAPRRGMRA